MFAFSTLSLVATLALGAFTSAAPTSVPIPGAPAVPSIPGVALPALPIVKRDCGGVYEIITTMTQNVTPHVYELKYLNQQNATIANIETIVVDIKGVLGSALTDIQSLVGQTSDVILAVEGGAVVTVEQLAQALSEVLVLVFEALGFVLSIVTSDIAPCVTYLLCGVGELLGCILCAVLMLVNGILGGLIGALVPLLGDVLSVISTLSVVVIVKVLGLSISI